MLDSFLSSAGWSLVELMPLFPSGLQNNSYVPNIVLPAQLLLAYFK